MKRANGVSFTGIPLHRTLEGGLDSGTIVIVPVPPKKSHESTKWVCLLIDQELSNRDFHSGLNGSRGSKWKVDLIVQIS